METDKETHLESNINSNLSNNCSSGINKAQVTSKKKGKDSKFCGLRKCFSALVDRKQVNLELEVLRLMLRKELNFSLENFEPILANMLPYLLVYYIKNWPGWQKSVEYYSGNITFQMWYDKFHKFITIKLNEAINVHYKEAMAEFRKENPLDTQKKYMLKKIVDHNTQTDNLAPKTMASFTIEISSEPVLLNTIVFTDSSDGDVILKQHGVLEWDRKVTDTITLKQLISWPHVGVHLVSPIFSFTRRNLHEFRRHISLVGTPLTPISVEFIEEIKVLNSQMSRSAFTLDYLKKMTREYLNQLRVVYTSPAIVNAFQTVIDEFLVDVEELNIQRNGQPTMANNTSVLFNISKCIYFRNKKLSKGIPSRYDIGYTEVIIPKIETALCVLENEKEVDAYLAHLKNFNSETSLTTGICALPQITFSCSYCQKNFDNGGHIANHLKDEHKMEQPLVCTRCKHPFPALDLSSVRWKHECIYSSRVK
ncbi:uncharacterized protein [Euwallacea fornicatus]|uniref:uncharacterized protein n=1 Tax=Euwallacea fornicatus TaxID=995702 RepID=UPI00338D50E1